MLVLVDAAPTPCLGACREEGGAPCKAAAVGMTCVLQPSSIAPARREPLEPRPASGDWLSRGASSGGSDALVLLVGAVDQQASAP